MREYQWVISNKEELDFEAMPFLRMIEIVPDERREL